MCDYSLMEYQNRLAVQGEFLIVHRFPTGSLGLASVHDCCLAESQANRARTFWAALLEFFQREQKHSVPAVCIPPGASLILHDVPPQVQKEFAIGPEEGVIFVQLSGAAYTYRDAVRFRTGQRAPPAGPSRRTTFASHRSRLRRYGRTERLRCSGCASGDKRVPSLKPASIENRGKGGQSELHPSSEQFVFAPCGHVSEARRLPSHEEARPRRLGG